MKKVAFGIALSALLVACGSGGGDSTQTVVQPLAKYVGTWQSACASSGGLGTSSYQVVQVNTLQTNGDLSFTRTVNYYNGASCAGAIIAVIGFPAGSTIHFDVAATISGAAVEKSTLMEAAGANTATGTAVSSGVSLAGAAIYIVTDSAGGISTYQQTSVAQSGKTTLKSLSATQFDSASAPNDAAGYPITFTGASIYTKQ